MNSTEFSKTEIGNTQSNYPETNNLEMSNPEMSDNNDEIRYGSSPDFCPPTEEGVTICVQDENGDVVELEFLGLLLKDDRKYAFFFPIDQENAALSSGEVILLEVLATDDDGQPSEFELVEDEVIANQVYDAFKQASAHLYSFS